MTKNEGTEVSKIDRSELIRVLSGPLFSKTVVSLLLLAAAILLVHNNLELIRENRRMVKFIKNKNVFQANLTALQKNEATFNKLVLTLDKKADLEKLKADHINRLLDIVKSAGMKMDSYNSEIQEKDGWVIFRHNVTLVGDFVNALYFFAQLREHIPYVYVARYDIRRYQDDQIRLGLIVEVLGNR